MTIKKEWNKKLLRTEIYFRVKFEFSSLNQTTENFFSIRSESFSRNREISSCSPTRNPSFSLRRNKIMSFTNNTKIRLSPKNKFGKNKKTLESSIKIAKKTGSIKPGDRNLPTSMPSSELAKSWRRN